MKKLNITCLSIFNEEIPPPPNAFVITKFKANIPFFLNIIYQKKKKKPGSS